jgi:hypothetical protein
MIYSEQREHHRQRAVHRMLAYDDTDGADQHHERGDEEDEVLHHQW